MGISMEVTVPMNDINAAEIVKMLSKMGAVTMGGYAVKDGRYIKGAKYEGGNLIKMGDMYFLVIWDADSGKVKLENIDFNDGYVLASAMPVAITGLTNGEKVLFACKDDAIEWLNTLKTSQILNLSVKEGDYHGSAVMYL